MNTNFFNLKKCKQDTILNAILKIFSEKPYQYSSTDEIVRESKISKGLLFHYFINKVGAYEFAYDYSLKLIMFELNAITNVKEEDYFQLWKHIEDIHLIVMKQYPYMLAFIERVYREQDKIAKKEIFDKEITLLAVYEQILDKANKEKFPKNGKVRTSTCYVLQGLNQEYYQKKELDIAKLYESKIEHLSFLQKMYNIYLTDL